MEPQRRIYFDNASGTRLSAGVLDAMMPFMGEKFGNPSSLNWAGEEAKQAVEDGRVKVSQLIGASPEEIVFVSSGSEGNNLALKGFAFANKKKGTHIVTSKVEHFSVLYSARALEKAGFRVSRVKVDKNCKVDPEDVRKAIKSDTILVSVMHSNNEVGTIEPIKEIASIAREKGAAIHTDCVSSCGNVPIDVNDLGVHLLTLSASQFGGPRGAGALYVRKGTRILPQTDGGIQEGGFRAGTESVSAIVGLGKAAEISRKEMESFRERMRSLRDNLERMLLSSVQYVSVNGHPKERLPGHLNICVDFVQGEAMLSILNACGIAASSGSSCASRALKASHVLLAMGLSHEKAQSSLLFTLWHDNDGEEVRYLCSLFPGAVKQLREMSPLYHDFISTRKAGSS